jgi:hypothetical protein
MSEPTATGMDWEARARAAEARVDELAGERARLWEELHHLRAERRQIEHYETVVNDMQNSLSWRLTFPVRWLTRFALFVRWRIIERD